jgi:GNAT superfamily N-acetyltransferase
LPDYRIDPFPAEAELDQLWRRAWNAPLARPMRPVLERSLGHVGAYEGDELIGFVNIAWDGGVHAFLLDTCTDPAHRRRGIATELVRQAQALARKRGAEWLHVDYEPHLDGFYRGCGFRPSAAGVMKLS